MVCNESKIHFKKFRMKNIIYLFTVCLNQMYYTKRDTSVGGAFKTVLLKVSRDIFLNLKTVIYISILSTFRQTTSWELSTKLKFVA